MQNTLFVVTITSKLSGCYNSALLAENNYADSAHVHVIDSKAVSGTEILIVDKLVELIKADLDFDTIVHEIEKFRDNCTLLFSLQDLTTLSTMGV